MASLATVGTENSNEISDQQPLDMDKWIQDNVKDQWYEVTYLEPNSIITGYTNSPLAPFHFLVMAAGYEDDKNNPIYRTWHHMSPAFYVEIRSISRDIMLWKAVNFAKPGIDKVKRDMENDGGFTVFNENRGYTNGCK